jgi:hypothetical protein
METRKHRTLDEDLGDFALYRKLRDWCVREGQDAAWSRVDGKGPYKRIERHLELEESPEVIKVVVEVSTSTQATEIALHYVSKGYGKNPEPREVHNPMIMVYADGGVIRTHGDFHRIRHWVVGLELTNPRLLVLLQELTDERLRFAEADRERMQHIVNVLVEADYYPEVSGQGVPALKMVENYGVDWHEFKGPKHCPFCNVDLCNHESGAPFKREVGEIQNDRLSHYHCPDCNGTWGRLG